MPKKLVKIKKIILYLLMLMFFAYLGMFIISNNSTLFLNVKPFIVATSSMEPQYKTNSVVFIKKEPIENLKVGDSIVFKSDALQGKLAFHRISRITSEGFYTKGDNNNYEDGQLVTRNTYVGKEVYHFNSLSRYVSAIKRPMGFILFCILPIFSIFICIKAIKELFLIKSQ